MPKKSSGKKLDTIESLRKRLAQVERQLISQKAELRKTTAARARVERAFSVMKDKMEKKCAAYDQQKRAILETHKSTNDLVENLIKTANAMLVILNVKGEIQVFNPAAERITGYKLREVKGRNYFDLIVPRKRFPETWRYFKNLPKTGMTMRFENIIVTKSGEDRYIHWQNSVIREKGKITGTVSFGIDITERKKHEATLLENATKFHGMFAAMNVGMAMHELVFDKKGQPIEFRLQEINPAYEKLTGKKSAEVIGKLSRSIYGTDVPPFLKEFSEVALSGRSKSLKSYFAALDKYVDMFIFSPRRGWFAVLFTDISDLMETEEIMKEYEEKWCKVFNSSPACITITRLSDGLLSDANEAALKLFGYSRKELVNRTTIDLGIWSEHGRERWVEALKRDGYVHGMEVELYRKNGEAITVILSGELIEIEGRKHIISVFMDITQTKIVQKHLEHDSKLNNTLLNIYEQSSSMKEEQLDEFVLNQAIQLTGSRRGFLCVVNQDQHTANLTTYDGAELSHSVMENEIRPTGKSTGHWRDCVRLKHAVIQNEIQSPVAGKFFPCSGVQLSRLLCVPVFENKKIKIILGVGDKSEKYEDDDSIQIQLIANEMHKIVQQRRVESALRDSEERFRTLVHQAPLPVAICDPDGRMRLVNDRFVETFGYSIEEIPNIDAWWKLVNPEAESSERAINKWRDEFAKVLKEHTTFVQEYYITCKDHSRRMVEVYANMIGHQIIFIFYDITERKQAEEEIRLNRDHLEEIVVERTKVVKAQNAQLVADNMARWKLQKELIKAKKVAEQASRAKSAFLASMSHEIRTPMNTILGFSQLILNDADLPERHREQIETINRSGEHLLALIDEVLEISKIEAGQATLSAHSFDLKVFLHDIEAMFRLMAEKKDLEFVVNYSGQIPPSIVCDEGKLRQVFINLLGNAIKFTEKGKVELRVQCEPDQGKGAHLYVEVEDTGPGIAPEEVFKLFQHFQQTQSGRASGGGTGLGLAISQEYVRLMGGEISVTSRRGEGSTFRFFIDITEAYGMSTDRTETRHVIGLEGDQEGIRVLIVDDQADNRTLLHALLEPMGFDVRMVADGDTALSEFAEWHPRLILMDIRLPGPDGNTVIRTIRQRPDGEEVKIIGLTASPFDEHRQETISAGADDFLGKPFRQPILLEKMGKLLELRYRYSESTPAARPHPEDEELVTAEALDRLPYEIIDQLRRATISGDFDRVAELAAEISAIDANLGRGLLSIARQFDAERLLPLLAEGEKP